MGPITRQTEESEYTNPARRVYVRVDSCFDETGYMCPSRIIYNGKVYPIDEVRSYCSAESVCRIRGDCFNVVIRGQLRRLFYEPVESHFRGRYGRWFIIPGFSA